VGLVLDRDEWDSRTVGLDDCWICHHKIDNELAAIGRSRGKLRYVPFVYDIRSSGLELAHPVCFASAHGVEALVSLVHERDVQVAEKFGPG
jgi:hypothetical protein